MTAALTDIQWAQLQEAWRVVDSDADGLVTCGMLSGSAWDAEAARTQRARAGRQTDSLPLSLFACVLHPPGDLKLLLQTHGFDHSGSHQQHTRAPYALRHEYVYIYINIYECTSARDTEEVPINNALSLNACAETELTAYLNDRMCSLTIECVL